MLSFFFPATIHREKIFTRIAKLSRDKVLVMVLNSLGTSHRAIRHLFLYVSEMCSHLFHSLILKHHRAFNVNLHTRCVSRNQICFYSRERERSSLADYFNLRN